MRRPAAVRTALVAVAIALLLPVAAGAQDATTTATTTSAAVNAPETPSSAAAILDLVGCVQSRQHLTVQLLIDESASLKVTDPENRRVDAALAALDGLVTLAEGTGTSATKVDVGLAAFSNKYRTVRDWTAVTPASAPSLRRTIERFRTRNRGTDTDFVNALTGARRSLADQAAVVTEGGGQAPCKTVLLFTDGQYDIAVRENAAQLERLGRTKPYAPGIVLDDETSVRKVEAAGREELCKVGGLADGIRRDDISLLTVALSSSVPRDQQRLLAAASAGKADGVTCGSPTDIPPGAYLPADQVDLLISRFDEIATRLAGGTLLPDEDLKLCDGSPCAEGTRTVPVDLSIRRVHLLALAPKPGMELQITTPGGSATIDRAGTMSIGDLQARVRTVAGRGYSVNVDRPAKGDGWTGTWSIVAIDTSGKQAGDPVTLQVYVSSDLGISLTGAGQLVRGGTQDVSAAVVVPKGVDGTKLIRSATATVRLTDPVTGKTTTVALTGPATGPLVGSVGVPASYRSSSVQVVAELQATTADGAQIVARSVPRTVLVRRPGDAVQFVPAGLEMPSLTGDGSTSGDLLLIGGKKAGCVWFPSVDATIPGGAGPLGVSYDGKLADTKAACIRVGAGQRVTVPVVIKPGGRATGTVSGALEIHEQVEGGVESTTLLPFGFEMSRGVDQARRLFLAVLLFLGGILLPLGLLYLVNAISARFQSLEHVQGAVIPVSVQNGRTLRLDADGSPRPFRITPRDFVSLAGRGGPRSFVFGGIEFRAVASPNPFGSTIALAAPEGGAAKLKGRAGSRVELDPHLVGTWVLLLDPDRTRDRPGDVAEGALIVFLAEGESADQIAALMPDIVERVPGTAAKLARLVREQRS